MKHSNCIVVFNKEKDKLLFCKRMKEPYKGLYNFVGGKVEPGESSEAAAYRELLEETGITMQNIKLYRLMDLTYYHIDFVLEIYVGVLHDEVNLIEEANPLEWLSVEEDFTDKYRFAGEQNIAHIINVANQYPFPIRILKNDGVYLGVDGCKGGWIAAVYKDGQLLLEKYPDIDTLVSKYPKFDEMLIDMVIGLPSKMSDVRPDVDARKIVSPRTSTVFAVPSRQAVYEYTQEKQIEANIRALGKSLPKQAMAIIPKMREVDGFLGAHTEYVNQIKESHPEVCFARLNGSVVMSKKSDREGIAERISILKEYLPELNVESVTDFAHKLACNADDVVDAIVLMVTGNLNVQGSCEIIPENVQEDEMGLRMQMIIPRM